MGQQSKLDSLDLTWMLDQSDMLPVASFRMGQAIATVVVNSYWKVTNKQAVLSVASKGGIELTRQAACLWELTNGQAALSVTSLGMDQEANSRPV